MSWNIFSKFKVFGSKTTTTKFTKYLPKDRYKYPVFGPIAPAHKFSVVYRGGGSNPLKEHVLVAKLILISLKFW
jgi:hypothetical protein